MLKDLLGYYKRNVYRMNSKELNNTILILEDVTSLLEKQLERRRVKNGSNTNARAS